jgi:hypothetical protein
VTKIHKALKLRHHKHTGKILAHKHTSYRVLFLLLLAPIFMMPLVDQLNVAALDFEISATVPAEIPSGSPTIDSPQQSASTTQSEIVVSGSCPVIDPAIIVAIYNNDVLAGSDQCSTNGTYTVTVPLVVGQNKLIATVVTFTGGVGNSSAAVTITRTAPPSTPTGTVDTEQTAPIEGFSPIVPPLQIIAKDIYVLMSSNGNATWTGSFKGGTPPYEVEVDWGDGNSDHRTVSDDKEQTFSNVYKQLQTYKIIIKVTDADNTTASLQSTAVTAANKQVAGVEKNPTAQVPPVIEFIQKNAAAVYVGSASALAFLWYLESGRHVLSIGKVIGSIMHLPVHKP